MRTDRSQRWRDRRAHYVPNASTIARADYTIDVVEHGLAKAFVAQHHYLGSYPAATVACGLFARHEPGKTALVGVAVFAVPVNNDVITRHCGLPASRGCVLGRFVLLDRVPGNGETFFLARALKLLRHERPAVEAVVSYADPLAGHIGHVYAAMSSAYRGQTARRTSYHLGGHTVSGRTLSKVRLDERGADGAIARLLAMGAPARRPGEAGAAWLDRLMHEHALTRGTHPGLHAYCFELGRDARRSGAKLPRHPYPRVLRLPNPGFALAA